ncbi:unnamed protein product [Ilex paraguariensis]|uniref:Uncharacterized protein n=1 Tax=Ilex paraguariensis TaxID=185542 RepID=A0ABC8RQ95_9AQUA
MTNRARAIRPEGHNSSLFKKAMQLGPSQDSSGFVTQRRGRAHAMRGSFAITSGAIGSLNCHILTINLFVKL